MYYGMIQIARHWTKSANSTVRLLCSSKQADTVAGHRKAGVSDVGTDNSEEANRREEDKNTVTIQRLITQDDLEKFSQLTGDHNPIHFASQGCSVVHGALLNGLVSGVIGTKLPGPGTVVVNQTLRFPSPCYVGDNVTITVTIMSARKIITCKYECSVGGKIVMDGEAKLVQSKLFNLRPG